MFQRYWLYWLAEMRKKVGLRTEEADDGESIQALLDWMQNAKADFTNTFCDLSSPVPPAASGGSDAEQPDAIVALSLDSGRPREGRFPFDHLPVVVEVDAGEK